METGVSIEWMILADAAQVVSNKLYLMGGGWDRYTAKRGFPAQIQFAVAVSLKVPWNETNQRHDFELEIATQDGQIIKRIDGQFEVGRPTGIQAGTDQRVQLALNGNLKLEKPGIFALIGRVTGQEGALTAFTVIDGSTSQKRS